MFVGFIRLLDVGAAACSGCADGGISEATDAFFSDDLHAVAPSNATVQQPKRNTCRVRDLMKFLLRQKQRWMAFSSIT
jgi:hypothetical protein